MTHPEHFIAVQEITMSMNSQKPTTTDTTENNISFAMPLLRG